MAKPPLHILLLEDSRFDAELIALELKNLGQPFQLDPIQSEAELRHALDFQPPDVVLSDHGLPSFNGFRALEIVRHERPELPFIFVSGSNNQQMVVDMHEKGATDYVFKRDLVELCPTIQRALTGSANSLTTDESDIAAETEPETVTAAPTVKSVGHLQFCPKCQQASDENGKMVEMGKYLSNYPEATVQRQICANCA
jgi:CheY-like chemotaxis protein